MLIAELFDNTPVNLCRGFDIWAAGMTMLWVFGYALTDDLD
jgi:hypothetical protein